MASDPSDALLLLRTSILSNLIPTLSPTDSLDTATELSFPPLPSLTAAPTTIPLSTLTRFIKDNNAVDLRSILFAWRQRDTAITQYIESAQALGVAHLTFIERLELVTYLEGGQEESDHIRPLPTASAPGAAIDESSSQSKAGITSSAVLVGKVRQTDPRLLEIYNYERVLTNRNVLLRGIKPTDFSHVRKHAENFITRLRNNATPAGAKPAAPNATLPTRPGHPSSQLATNPKSPGPSQQQRPQRRTKDSPIIMLSPSASAILNMQNIKPFLESGEFIMPTLNSAPAQNVVYISRHLPGVNPAGPIRFTVVDSPDKFKPDHWDRLVAVFTTGQEWQFKSYKWSNPVELFRHVMGFYFGFEGERVPEPVKRWGKGVNCFAIDRSRRWRDMEMCEKFWEGVEVAMKAKGWGR